MNIYEPRPGMYDFKILPGFARYILENHLEEFVADQLHFSRMVELPLLRHLGHLSDAAIIEFGKGASVEYLKALSEGRAAEQMKIAMDRWRADQLKIIGKFALSAEDITVFNHMRGKLFRKWARSYDIPPDDKFELLEEIETLLFGTTTSSTNIFIDILQTRIREESHFTQQLINTSPAIIFIFDVEKNKEVYINGNVQPVMGYSAEEVIGMESNILQTLTHPDDLPILYNHLEAIMEEEDGKSHQLEYRFRHKDGSYKWLRTYDVVFKRSESGKPSQLLGTTFEVTHEKEIGMALEKRESQLLEAQAIAQIGSFEWNMVDDTSVTTPELLRIFGMDMKDAISHRTFAVFLTDVHPADKERMLNAVSQARSTGHFDCQYRYRAKGKEKFLWTRGVIEMANGKPSIMRGTVQDITQLKLIEQELLKKTIELERSNESLQQFASIASHDLKEPLRKMSMYTDMVMTMEEKLSDQSHQNLSKVKSSSIRMQNMIDDILNFSSITNGESTRPVSLTAVMREVGELLEETIVEKQAVIHCDDLPPVMAIQSQMRQLFQNLISNALKFSTPERTPVIRITHRYLSKEEMTSKVPGSALRYVEISIADNGIGFKQEYAEKIFGLFTRLHARATYEGTGLGLSICKRIVENHGGKIEASSVPGQGAVFTIILPDEG
jgi:PAS domain S-box-containing protein